LAIRNRAELLRLQYADVIGAPMPPATLRRLLLDLIEGTPWQYYEYALEQTELAPRPSWRYAMAIVSRVKAEAVPVEALRQPKPSRRAAARILASQDYSQREYTHSEALVDAMMAEFLKT
jgi:hypothetical protein